MTLKKKINILSVLIFSISYVFFPWENINGKIFADIDNYLYSINDFVLYPQLYDFTRFSLFELLKSEAIWKYLLVSIALIFKDHLLGFKILSIVPIFFYTLFFRRYLNWGIILIFFFNPLFIDLINGQTRSALAFSIFLFTTTQIERKWMNFFLLMLTPFIHLIGFVLLLMTIVFNYLGRKKIIRFLPITCLICGLLFNMIYFVGQNYILEVISKGKYTSSSISFSVIWFLPLIIVVLFPMKRNFVSFPIELYYLMIFFTSIFIFSSFFEFYGSRVFALTFPILLVAVKRLPKHLSIIGFSIIFIFQIIQYYYWLNN